MSYVILGNKNNHVYNCYSKPIIFYHNWSNYVFKGRVGLYMIISEVNNGQLMKGEQAIPFRVLTSL